MYNKKGISTIVATVLIVLITVAAVTILWAAISPLLGGDLEGATDCFSVTSKYKIDPSIVYSGFDDDIDDATTGAVDDAINVRVQNTGDAEAVGIVLSVNVDGTTVVLSATTPNFDATIGEDGGFPTPTSNGASVIKIPEGDLNLVELTPASVVTASVAAIISVDGVEKVCDGSPEVAIRHDTDLTS